MLHRTFTIANWLAEVTLGFLRQVEFSSGQRVIQLDRTTMLSFRVIPYLAAAEAS